MIKISELVFEYPGTLALDNVSLHIVPGDICALVGPNGAGKTTLLRCIAALDVPISGTVYVNDINVLEQPRQVHQMIGYLADFYGLYTELTVEQSLTYAALAHAIPQQRVKAAVHYAAQRLQIEQRLQNKVGELSRGLSQRLAIAQAIVHEPQLLLLDEPASGLDPEARRALSELFLALQAQGMTLLVSSHILAELEEYCSSMIILKQGRVIEHQQLAGVDSQLARIQISLLKPHPALHELFAAMPDVEVESASDDTWTIRIKADTQRQQQILVQLISAGVPLYRFAEEKLNMHDAYLQKINTAEEVPGA